MTRASELHDWLHRLDTIRHEVEDANGYRHTIGDSADLNALLTLTCNHLRRMELNAKRRERPMERRAA